MPRDFEESAPRGERKWGGRPGGGRPGPGGRPGSGGPGGMRKRPFLRKKICRFCSEGVAVVDYKDREALRRFLTEKGKIIPRRTTGNCAKCQRKLVRSIKRARHAGLSAFQEI